MNAVQAKGMVITKNSLWRFIRKRKQLLFSVHQPPMRAIGRHDPKANASADVGTGQGYRVIERIVDHNPSCVFMAPHATPLSQLEVVALASSPGLSSRTVYTPARKALTCCDALTSATRSVVALTPLG